MLISKLGMFISQIFTAVQTIEPTGSGPILGEKIGWLFTWLWEAICLGIYNIVKWLLALVDFMQYFVQKLIGLDYWLNSSNYTIEGAVDSDLIFGFLYNDTVQKVFRAMMGLFFVLLIIFTIYAIIKSEWEHINGTGKGGKFGDGTGNSKTRIFRSSIKAIAIVLIFPIMLMVGIISANAILASLIKALNIDTSSTLGGQLFQIASQNANKYEKYAHDTEGRTAVSDTVTFYIDSDGKYITLGGSGTSDVVHSVSTFEAYLEAIKSASRYTVNSVFERIGGVFDGGFDKTNWSGYISKLTVKEKPYYIMATCRAGKGNNEVTYNDPDAMYYYLKCVLQVPIVTKNSAQGFDDGVKTLKGKIDDKGYISNVNLNDVGYDDIEQAMRNTWNYASIYKETYGFEDSLGYVVTRAGSRVNDGVFTGTVNSGNGILEKCGLGVNSAKIMYNSPVFSTYFDGGERGIVQMQAEYLVMSEVIDFINQNNFRLHILDINSPLINWGGVNGYAVTSKWIGNTSNKIKITYGSSVERSTIPFVISYSDACNETEMGNVLYFGDDVGNGQSELDGAKYIMCIKVDGASNSTYIPLVNNKSYTDPVTGKQYTFSSTYYSSSYQGVVLAKGLLDSGATDAYRGEPTYFVSDSTDEDGEYIGTNEPYYYEMVQGGGFATYGKGVGNRVDNTLSLKQIDISLSGQNYYYDIRSVTNDENKEKYEIYKCITEDGGETPDAIVTPTADLVRNLQLTFKDDSNNVITAQYANVADNNYYLFMYNHSGKGYYFMVYADTTNNTISIMNYYGIVMDRGAGANLIAGTRLYDIRYDYKNGSNEVTYESITAGSDGVPVGYTPDYFTYSKTASYKIGTGDDEHTETKAIYSTVDMESISNSSVNLSKTGYLSVAFNTTSQDLVTIKNGKVEFAEIYEPTGTSIEARQSDKFVQSSSFFEFYLYDFYHADINGSVKIQKYSMSGNSFADARRPDSDDDDFYFECKVDENDFSFAQNETQLHLYDGKKYVATIYKAKGVGVSGISDLKDKTTYILYNDHIYYNIKTQNHYDNETSAKTYFQNVGKSMVIRCVRDNRSMLFFDFDFYVVSIIPQFKVRNNIGFFMDNLEREWVGKEFYITDGIQFDYFFEGEASLITFYIPSKISYWIIILASALMIKVLGTAIWGVIKRIYEITLYFIAAPAVASTIPLDDGQKFTSQIQQPLVKKVLGTYGVMLGINVFFILLYPVKSLSQIFTPEEIATSDSYFLKNFFSLFGREFQAKMLNMYVYILFVLVAFTMISALPGVIASMLGAEDVYKNGGEVKKQASGALKEGMDFASGKNLVNAGKKAVDGAKNSLPGKAIGGVVKAGKWAKNKASKGVPDDSGDESEGSGSSRSLEEKLNDDNEVRNQFDQKFNDMAGNKFGGRSYDEVMQNGTEEEKAQAKQMMNEAQTEVGQEIDQNGTDAQKEAFSRVTAQAEAEESEATPEDSAEAVAKQQFESSTGEIAQQVIGASGDAKEMERNAVVNMAGSGNAVANKVVAQALGAKAGADGTTDLTNNAFDGSPEGKERKKQAVLSTMNEEEKAKFEKMNSADQDKVLQQYDVSATMDQDGKVAMAVTKARDAKGNTIQDAQAVSVGESATNSIMQNVAQQTAKDNQSAMNNAVDNTDGAKETVTSAIAGNIANVIDFSKAGTEGQDAVAEMIVDNVLEDPTDAKNSNVIDNAILAFLQDPENKKVMKNFQKLSGLSDEQMQNKDLVLKSIETLRAGGTGIDQLGLTADDYKNKMGGAIQEAVTKGEFSVSAWEVFKNNDPNASEYIDQVSAENMVRNDSEAQLEKEMSLDNLENQIKQIINGLLTGKDFASEAQKTYEAENSAGSWAKLSKDEQDQLTEEKRTELTSQAEAQARGQMIFSAFADDTTGKSTEINKMLMASMGIDTEAGQQNTIVNAVANGQLTGNAVSELKTLKGYNDQDIALAIKSLELLGQDVNKDNISTYLDTAKTNPDMHNAELLEAMQNDTTGAVDKDKMYQMLGGNDIIDEEQKQQLTEKVASNGMLALDQSQQDQVKQAIEADYSADYDKEHGAGSWAKLSQAEQDKLLTEKANGMSLYEVNTILNGGTQRTAFDELREKSKRQKTIDEAIEANPDISADQLMEVAGNDPEAQKYIADSLVQRATATTDEDAKNAQREAENEIIKANTTVKDSNGKVTSQGADISTDSGLATAYQTMTGLSANEAQAELDTEVNSQISANVTDKINSNKDLRKERDKWLKANPNKTQADFVAMMVQGAEKGDPATLQALGYADKNAFDAEKTEFARKIVISKAKETYDGFEADVSQSASKIVEKQNVQNLLDGKGAEMLKTAEILDSGNASGTYRKFVTEAETEYKRLYGQDANLAKVDPLARASFLTGYMNKKGFKLEADDAVKVTQAGTEAKAVAQQAGDKAAEDTAEKIAKEEYEKSTGKSWNNLSNIDKNMRINSAKKNHSAEIEQARQTAGLFAQVTADPEQFTEMMTVMESYDGGENGNKIAQKLKRTVMEQTYDSYQKQGIELSIAKDPETMNAKEKKRFEFNKGILQQEMRTNNDVVGNLFKNTNIFNQEGMIASIARSSGMTFDETKSSWVDQNGQVLKDDKGNNIGKDNLVALKAHLDNTAIANYMNAHEDSKNKLLNLGAQNMMLTMDKETQDIKKADAVLESSYLRNEVATKVITDAGNAKGQQLTEDNIKQLIKEMLKADGREGEATDENITKNFNQYKAELALHDLSNIQVTNGQASGVGGRNADAFVKASGELENTNAKFASMLDKKVTSVIDPSNYDPDTSAKEFFESKSISDFRADDGSEIKNIADAIDAFHKENFGGFKKGAKNIAGDKNGGMTSGGFVGGLKTMFVGGYGEGKDTGNIVGNNSSKGGIVGGAKTIAVDGVLGSAGKLLTLKGVRAGAKAIKDKKEFARENGRDVSYVKYKAGGYELDENGKVKRDEKGNAILVKKQKLSGAEEQYAKEQYAKEQYDALNGAGEFDKLSEADKQTQIDKYSANFDSASSTAKEGYASGFKNLDKMKKEAYAEKAVIEGRAKENFARDEFAKEQYAKEHGSLDGFDKLDATQKSQYTAGFAKLSQEDQAKYSSRFDSSTDAEKNKYLTEAGSKAISQKELENAQKGERNKEYAGKAKRFARTANSVMDNTAIGSILKQSALGVSKIGAGVGLGIGKIGAGAGLGVARGATKVWTSTAGKAAGAISRKHRIFKSNNNEMIQMVSEARKDKLIMREVGENASTAKIARYLDKNKTAGENMRNRVYANKARELANTDQAFADELTKAGVDLTDDNAIAKHLNKNKKHREKVKGEIKNSQYFNEAIASNSSINNEVKSRVYSDKQIEDKLNSKINNYKVSVTEDDIARQAYKSANMRAKLGKNATLDDYKNYLNSHQKEKDLFTKKAKIQAVRENRGGVLDKMLVKGGEANVNSNGEVELTKDVARKTFKKMSKEVKPMSNNVFGKMGGTFVRVGGKSIASAMSAKEGVATFFTGKKIGADFVGTSINQKEKEAEKLSMEKFGAGAKIDAKTKENIMASMVGGDAVFKQIQNDKAQMKALEAKYNKLSVGEAKALLSSNGYKTNNINNAITQYAKDAHAGKREGFTKSYLAKGTLAGLKGLGKGALGAVTIAPIRKSFVKTFVGGEKDSMGKRHFEDSRIARAGKGIGNRAIVGANAVIFKTAKKLPAMCNQYVNWNKILEHKITAIKNDTKLTREQKTEQIRIFESQKIYLKKPDAYANMSADEQNAFDLAQDKLKRQAYTDSSLASFVKKMERAEKAGNPAGVGLPGELDYVGAPSKSRKEKHLDEFNKSRAVADRFRATAAMRNKERDYGDNFEKFAQGFMSKQRYIDMMKRYKLKTAIQYQMMTADQKEKERKKREQAINAQLSRINKILAKKVAKDNKVSTDSYLASRGITPEVARFKDGSFRYRDIQNAIPKTGLASLNAQVGKGARSNADILKIQNETININNMMNEFIKFTSTFKGSSKEFAEQFRKEFAKFGPYAQKIYDKYTSSFKRLGKQIVGMNTSLDATPIAVQQRKIMEGLSQELSKCKSRVTMGGKIPASSDINNMFVGKTYSGATTQAEVALHKQTADELSRLLKLIKEQRNHVSYASLTQRLAGVHYADFASKNPNINGLSEEAKKNKLEQYFKNKLDKALKVVHNDGAQVADKHNLEKLSGRRVKRSEIDHSKHSATMSDAMKTQNNPVYQNLIREANSATEKHKLERGNLDDLMAMLRKLQAMPRTPKIINEISNVEKAIRTSQVKLKNLKTVMDSAQKRKRDYEQAFASTQIKEAKANTRVLAYNNSTSVLDRYHFEMKGGKTVEKGSVEAKEVQMLVNKYISSYKQTIQKMINSEQIKSNDKLKRYVDGMKNKFTSDFGRNMKYTRDVKEELTKYIEQIKASGDKADQALLTSLQDFVNMFNNSTDDLENAMKKLGIDVSKIKLKK